MQPTTQHIRAELLNLCIKAQARLLENSPSLDTPGGSPQEEPLSPPTASATSTTSAFEEAQAAAAAAGARGAGEGAGTLRQSVAVNILDPVNLVVNTWLSPDRQAVDVEMSALRVKLSPDVLQLILHLQKVSHQGGSGREGRPKVGSTRSDTVCRVTAGRSWAWDVHMANVVWVLLVCMP